MNAIRLALVAAALAGATAQAQPVESGKRAPVGFAPHQVFVLDEQSASDASGALYIGGSVRPLPIFLPEAAPPSVPMTVEAERGATGLPRLFSLLTDDDEPDMHQSRRGHEERDGSRHRHPHPHHRDIDLGEGGEHGEHGGTGGSGGVTSVPLPPALPLLGSVLAALLLVGAATRRS